MRITEEQAKKILGDDYKAPPKARQPKTERKFCIYCKKLVAISKPESFSCRSIPFTDPVEVECFHLECEKS